MAFIGIDLGTTNSLVCAWKNEHPILIPNALGETLTPSAISVGDDNSILIGQPAKDRLVSHPDRSTAFFKRLMGTDKKVQLAEKTFSPEELSSIVLSQLKLDAEAFLNEPVEEAIISVPAYFNDNQRNATLVAAQLAGIKVERLINEPTAAAIAYGIHNHEDERRFIVVDLGGGTFDVSIMEKFEDLLEVHATSGDSFLGGEDFTQKLCAAACQKNELEYSTLSSVEQGHIYHCCNALKYQLSENDTATVNFNAQGESYEFSLSREEFFHLVEPLLKRILAPLERSIRDSNLAVSDIDDVFLVGGATRMPAIRQFMTKLFGRFPSCDINPDHAVAHGAAIQAALKQRNEALKDVVLTDVCPFSMGVETAHKNDNGGFIDGLFSVIIERNQTIPCSREERFYTLQDNQKELQVNIFQGENRLVKDNIKLGELLVSVPKKKAGEECMDVRFTYDINGLLEVLVKIPSTGVEKQLVIQNSGNRMTDAQIEKALIKLRDIKIHPRDQAENQALLARAGRLYEERLGVEREQIANAAGAFEQILASQDEREIRRAAKQFDEFLKQFESDFWG